MTSGRVLGAAVAIAVLAVVAAGLWMIGSPGDARRLRLDARRLGDLRAIATIVDVHWSRERALPASLDEISPAVGATSTVDPVSGQRYEYRVIDAGAYELCATFEAEWQPGMYGYDDAFWRHGAGRHCFRLTPKEIKRS
jgi:hypothetical protein